MVIDQDNKIIKITSKNNKLNTIIQQNDIQQEKMQKHFQKEIASKERVLVKLEMKLEHLMGDTLNDRNKSDELKEQHQILTEQIMNEKNDKLLIKQKLEHLNDKLSNKEEYIQTLKKQINDNNEHIAKLHEENETNKTLSDQTIKQFETSNVGINAKYKSLQVTAQKLANKLKQTIEAKKNWKKQYNEKKRELDRVLAENERIEKETEKQCDAIQIALDNNKNKIIKKNKQIKELEQRLNELEAQNNEYQQQNQQLLREKENHKFLIEHLEIDNNQKQQIRKKNRSVLEQVINENVYSQKQCNQILQEIDDEEEDEQDIDLQTNNIQDIDINHNGSGFALDANSEQNEQKEPKKRDKKNKKKRKRKKNEMDDQKEEDIEFREPPKKKKRNNNNLNISSSNISSSTTPFKASNALFKPRKKSKRNKNGAVNLPKPKIK